MSHFLLNHAIGWSGVFVGPVIVVAIVSQVRSVVAVRVRVQVFWLESRVWYS